MYPIEERQKVPNSLRDRFVEHDLPLRLRGAAPSYDRCICTFEDN